MSAVISSSPRVSIAISALFMSTALSQRPSSNAVSGMTRRSNRFLFVVNDVDVMGFFIEGPFELLLYIGEQQSIKMRVYERHIFSILISFLAS